MNFFKLGWVTWVIIAIVFIMGYAIYSLITRKYGSWNSLVDDFVPPTSWYVQGYDDTSSKGESMAKKCLEDFFKVEFKKVRIIPNPNTGQMLELDCYNDQLKIALEYQGIQHYKFVPYFHGTVEKFKDQLIKDEYKALYCKKNKIKLIIVPYNLKLENICTFIRKQL